MNQLTTEVKNRALPTTRERVINMTSRSHLRVFKVDDPVTVFVRGTRCQVKVRYHDLDQVEIHARLYNAFGLRFVVQQDEAGVYIVVKRRRFLGLISKADFLLQVPRYAHLAFNLTPGQVLLSDLQGIAEILPLKQHVTPSLHQIGEGQVK